MHGVLQGVLVTAVVIEHWYLCRLANTVVALARSNAVTVRRRLWEQYLASLPLN